MLILTFSDSDEPPPELSPSNDEDDSCFWDKSTAGSGKGSSSSSSSDTISDPESDSESSYIAFGLILEGFSILFSIFLIFFCFF